MLRDYKPFLIIKVEAEAQSSFKKAVNTVYSFFGWGEEQKMTRNFVSGAFETLHTLLTRICLQKPFISKLK